MLKWTLAAIYAALCFGLIYLFPQWLWVPLVLIYVLFVAWRFWTQETSYGKLVHLRPLTHWDLPDYDLFHQEVQSACIDVGLRREPILTVEENEDPNAMAVGGRRGLVIFTTGLLKTLPQEEITALAARELSHLASRDHLPALVGGTWLHLVGWISYFCWRAASDLKKGGIDLFSIMSLPLSLFSLVLDLAIMAVSAVGGAVLARRSRHAVHLADLAGARITSPGTMIGALERLAEIRPITRRKFPAWSPAWIAWKLYASHPETPLRVQFLRDAEARGEIRV